MPTDRPVPRTLVSTPARTAEDVAGARARQAAIAATGEPLRGDPGTGASPATRMAAGAVDGALAAGRTLVRALAAGAEPAVALGAALALDGRTRGTRARPVTRPQDGAERRTAAVRAHATRAADTHDRGRALRAQLAALDAEIARGSARARKRLYGARRALVARLEATTV